MVIKLYVSIAFPRMNIVKHHLEEDIPDHLCSTVAILSINLK